MIVALDLSLTNLGMVACPPSWDLSWDRVAAFETRVTKPGHLVARIEGLAAAVVRFCRENNASEVWAEDLAPNQGYAVVVLAELRYGVRRALHRELGIDLQFASEAAARKLLLGWLPQKRKEATCETLKLAGDPFDDDHQRDAFCCLNWVLHEMAAPCLHGLLGEKPVRSKRSRKRAIGSVLGTESVIV